MALDLSAHIEQDLRLHSWEADSRVQRQLHDEQARLVWSQSYLMITLGLAVGLALLGAQWPVIDHGVLAGWFAVLVVGSVLWSGFAVRYRRASGATGIGGRWMQYAVICALLYGLVWSAAALLLFPSGILAHQAILTIMLGGISSGAIATLSATSATGAVVILPALLPLAYQFALERTPAGLLILAILLLLLLILVLANRHLYQTLRRALRLRIEKELSEAALHESETRYRLLFNHIPLGVLHYDAGGVVLDCNAMSAEILGTSRNAILGRNIVEDADNADFASAARSSVESGWGYYEGPYEWDGGTRELMLRGFFNAVERPDEQVIGGVAILEDFTTRKRAEEATYRMAYCDPLTDLPNRRLLDDRLQLALASSSRHGYFGALIFLDIDYFKRINDRLGHRYGDEVLRTIGSRLQGMLRREDTVARLSGDEFILLLPDLGPSATSAERGTEVVCRKVQAGLQEPIVVEGHELRVTASLGITIFPHGDATSEELLRRSDAAMYEAKRAVRGELRFYEPHSDEEFAQKAELEHDLAFALEREELFLEYQPMVDAQGRVVGTEALIRWQHPRYGKISPGRFIPVAEETGLIIPIGQWALRQACRRLAELDGATLGHVSVNVSTLEFRHRDFVHHVEQCLEELGAEADRLVLEVTENVLIEDLDEAIHKMEQLRRHGVRFEIDDFGTGYSSLTYLKRLPVDGVKIDRSFIRDLEWGSEDAAIVEAIMAVAERLGVYVVAEGIERAEQFELLRRHGCNRFQGWYWGAPGPVEGLLASAAS